MEETILANLIENEKFTRKVIPYLTEELFAEESERILFGIINEHVEKYNALPSKEVLHIELGNQDGISDIAFSDTQNLIRGLETDDSSKLDWLLDNTEKFIQDRSLHNAIRQSIRILDAEGEHTKAAIPELLQEALGISFDTQVGHDVLADTKERFDHYHLKQNRLRFNLDYLNRITNGGLPTKTLSCILAGTGVGKSLSMCSMAAGNLMDQKNVLYISLELSEEMVAQRIDQNLLDVTQDELMDLSRDEFERKVDKVRESTKGKFVVKSFPPASVGSGHFRHLLNELRVKKNFIPNVIYLDYINLCTSARIKAGSNFNSYTYIKAIAEEIRGLAVEFDVPIITATQTNRDAVNSSDIELDNTSDSMGLPMTLDFMVALISTEELEEQNQLMVKQLKNRFGDPSTHKRFLIGVDRAKMRLYDIDSSYQVGVMGSGAEEDVPLMDSTAFGEADNDRSKKFQKNKFKGFS